MRFRQSSHLCAQIVRRAALRRPGNRRNAHRQRDCTAPTCQTTPLKPLLHVAHTSSFRCFSIIHYQRIGLRMI
jgi:hypothetical protein